MLSALSWKGKGMENLSTKCILSQIVSYRWEKSTLCKLIKILKRKQTTGKHATGCKEYNAN